MSTIQIFESKGTWYDEELLKGRSQLSQLQDIVDGYIEVVPIGNGVIAVVNEEGLIMGLPYNEDASQLAGMDLYGDVVIMDSVDLY
jgi:hypothetical protein